MQSYLHIILTKLPKLRPVEIFYVSKAIEDQAMSIATVTTAFDEIKKSVLNCLWRIQSNSLHRG